MEFSNNITLIKNKRGVYDLDTSKGCHNGMKQTKNGCYYECYANRNLRQYGFNFKQSTKRNINDIDNLIKLRNDIQNAYMPFIRIGVSGDPSDNWDETIRLISLIHELGKKIVIITKHWNTLSDNQLKTLSKYNVIINTSVSALDENKLLIYRLEQYKRIKNYCKSILRIVSCDFNYQNINGLYKRDLQEMLFDNENIIDTVYRISKNNPYLKSGLINANKIKFIDSECLASIYDTNTFLGYCKDCPELCGINI